MSILSTQFNLKTDNNGLPGTIINNPLNVGDKFFVEVLFGDLRPNAVGIASSAVNLSFDPNQVQNINNPFNAAPITSTLVTSKFPFGRTGTLDNMNGLITNLGGGSLPVFGIGSPLGINQLETFSLLHFQIVGSGNSSINLNVDLEQTGFANGTLANPQSLSQFSQVIRTNSPQAIPEPTPIFGLLLIGVFLLTSCRRSLICQTLGYIDRLSGHKPSQNANNLF